MAGQLSSAVSEPHLAPLSAVGHSVISAPNNSSGVTGITYKRERDILVPWKPMFFARFSCRRFPVHIIQQPGTALKSYSQDCFLSLISDFSAEPRGSLQLPFPACVLKSRALTTGSVVALLIYCRSSSSSY